MGNILSRCSDEISHVFRNCRSQKSEDERKHRRNLDVRNRHDRQRHSLDRSEEGLVHYGQHSPAAESRRELLGSYSSRTEDDWLPECDQTGDAHQCPRSTSADSFLQKNRDYPTEPILSKEYIIQTYKITNPREHACGSRHPSGHDSDVGSECLGAAGQRVQVERQGTGSGLPSDLDSAAFERAPVMKPHCSEFRPKRADTLSSPQKTVEEIAMESFQSHLRWKKEMDAIDSCVQSKLADYLTKRAKIRPTVKLQPKSLDMDDWPQKEDAVQPSLEIMKDNDLTLEYTPRAVFVTSETVAGVIDVHQEKDSVQDVEMKQKVDLLRQRESDVSDDPQKQSDLHVSNADSLKSESIPEKRNTSSNNLPCSDRLPVPVTKYERTVKLDGDTIVVTCFDPERKVGKQDSRTQQEYPSVKKDAAEQELTERSRMGNMNADWTETGMEKSGGEEEVPERVRKLQERQEKVLQELQRLQQSVQSLAQQRGVNLAAAASPTIGSTGASASQQSPLQNGKLHDLVISADPSSVPLSLLILLKQLSAQCPVLTSTFVHSSATDTPEKLRGFLQNGAQGGARSTYQLAVTVVWKKISNGPKMMVSPTCQTYIEGEANIARYLSRLLQPAYDSSDIITATQIDELLDLSQQQILGGNNKERSAAMRTLNARLGKGQWLVGSSLSLADVVAWSAVQGTGLAGDAPANVKKWLKACADSPLFQEAVKFISS